MQTKKEIERIYFKERHGDGLYSEMVYRNTEEGGVISYGSGYIDFVKFKDALEFYDSGNDIVFTFSPNDAAKCQKISINYGDFATLRQMLIALELSDKIEPKSTLGEIEFTGKIKID
jgi:hypothetical protein